MEEGTAEEVVDGEGGGIGGEDGADVGPDLYPDGAGGDDARAVGGGGVDGGYAFLKAGDAAFLGDGDDSRIGGTPLYPPERGVLGQDGGDEGLAIVIIEEGDGVEVERDRSHVDRFYGDEALCHEYGAVSSGDGDDGIPYA